MPGPTDTVVSALRETVTRHPGSPLVTFYDGASGERVELSGATFDNWVVKVANLFTDQLMLDPGQVVAVDLPTSWQSTVTIAAAWSVGLAVLVEDLPGRVDGHVVGPAAVDAADSYDGLVIYCSLRPLAGRATGPLPAGWLDFGAEVPGQPDALMAEPADDARMVAVTSDGHSLTHADLMSSARRAAADLHLEPGGRLVTDVNPSRMQGLVAALAAPLAAESSIVLLANCDDDARKVIGEQERVTASLWSTETATDQSR